MGLIKPLKALRVKYIELFAVKFEKEFLPNLFFLV